MGTQDQAWGRRGSSCPLSPVVGVDELGTAGPTCPGVPIRMVSMSMINWPGTADVRWALGGQ